MRMKILDYALLTLFSGATPLVWAQAAPGSSPGSAPSTSSGGATITAKEADCGASGCKSDEGLLFRLQTRGERDPASAGTDERSGDERLQPDRRVTIEREGVLAQGSTTQTPLPGKASASGKFSLQLPNGGIVWATEDPTLGVAELSVSGPSVVAFENGRITKPVQFFLRSNYPGFIQRIELIVYRASDNDLTEPLASLPMPVAGVSRAEWDGQLNSRYPLRAGDELIYIVRAYGADGAMDETTPRSIALVRTEDAERGATCLTPGGCASELHKITVSKALTGETGSQPGIAEIDETLTYTITLTNPGNTEVTAYALQDELGAGLTYLSSSPAGAHVGQTTSWTDLRVPANGTLRLSLQAKVDKPLVVTSVRNLAWTPLEPKPPCPAAANPACVETPTGASVTPVKLLTAESGRVAGVAEPGESLTYTITLTNTGGTAFPNYRFIENVPPGATLASVTGAGGLGAAVRGPGTANLVVPSVPANGVATVTVVFKIGDTLPGGLTALPNVINGGDIDPACAAACTVTVRMENPKISLVKAVAVREAKIGDLVRYTLTLTNSGPIDLAGGRVVDTPPAGFSFVAGSAAVDDGDGAFTTGAGASPMVFGGIDVASGKQAIISYLLRVGAGVRRGVHQNQAGVTDAAGTAISNTANAEVNIVADSLTDESLIVGTVFEDRDGDGWQAPAGLSGLRVQGGFAPGVYIANSTTVDTGQGVRPEPDASAPLLRGIALGGLDSGQPGVDAGTRQIVIRQRLSQASFTDDFVLTNAQGATVRMDAAGRTTLTKTGDAAKGLSVAEPSVQRRTTAVPGGFEVDYTVRNLGIAERGIPGVRIASVEGLIVETDQYGRYSLVGVDSGNWSRGRNFILKVDPTSLPAGAMFTTANPLVRRLTPGMPARFDFGIRLPRGQGSGGPGATPAPSPAP